MHDGRLAAPVGFLPCPAHSVAEVAVLQEAIALVKKQITDFPLQYGNFRD